MTDEETLNVQEEQNEPTDQAKKRRPSKGFNAKVGEAELLAEAMGANQEALTTGGGGEDFVNELKGVVTEIKQLNQEQEKWKADLKNSTTRILLKMKELDRLVRKGRRIVKNEITQERWVEFGIKATW